jgi:hypothetical protein
MTTKNKLRCELELRPYPYPDENDPNHIGWGILSLFLLASRDTLLLFSWEWDLLAFAEWFVESRKGLCDGVLSVQGNGALQSENLSQALQRLQSRHFHDDEDEAMADWFNHLYSFRQQHALRAALRGAHIPDIIIGLNHGSGEISLVSEDVTWVYQFDMDDFCLHLRQVILEFLVKCSSISQFIGSRARATNILSQLMELR